VSPPRDDIETTSPGLNAHCPVCGGAFHRVRRQRFCSPACRQAQWRSRQPGPLAALERTAAAIPPRRRDVTVYTCPDCEQRYLAQQWCQDCNRPCTRTGIGGLCPECDQPVTIDDLITQHQYQTIQDPKIR